MMLTWNPLRKHFPEMTLPENVDAILPLSPVQAGMLFHSIGDGDGPGTYVGVVSVVVEGALEAAQFKHAFSAAIRARDVLRASFVYKDIKTPVQVIHRQVDVPWRDSNWTSLTPQEVEHRKKEEIERERRNGFDLGAPPLMRAHLIRLANDRHLFIWSIHHILSDGWSTTVILDDVLRRYESDEIEQDHPHNSTSSFRDYLVWLKKLNRHEAENYWSRHLLGSEGPTRIPALPPKAQSPALHQIRTRQLPGSETETLNEQARKMRVTQSSFLAAIWALTLRRYSGSEDVTFGMTTAGRPVDLPGVARAVGPFLNTLPFRVKTAAEMTVQDVITRVEATMRERAPHEFVALTDVRDWSGAPLGQQLFDTLFAHESIPELGAVNSSLRLSEMEIIGPSNYGIALVVTPVDGLKLDVYFDPKHYDADLVDAILSDYLKLLKRSVEFPSNQVSALLAVQPDDAPDATEDERDFPSVIEAFEKAADAFPDANAVSDGKETLSYQELRERVLQIVEQLNAARVESGDIVPVAVDRSVQAIAAYLAVMATGATYVPMDLDYPRDILRKILDAVSPKTVLTINAAHEDLPGGAWITVCIDTLGDGPSLEKLLPPPLESTAYVLFTSGSQGNPKGVVVSHGALAHSTFIRNEVYGASPDTFLLLSSFAFDSSIAGIYWTICTGGHLIIAPRHVERDPAALGELLQEHRVTHTLCLPGLYGALLGAVDPKRLARLDTVIVAGEAMEAELIPRHRALLLQTRLLNEYGPTEATVWATVYNTENWTGQDIVPIGDAIPAVDVDIRDVDGVPLPARVQGEICISGPTVADGYLNNDNETVKKFVVPPQQDGSGSRLYRTGDLGVSTDDGLLYAGRSDQQIKIRGHRVEAGEIEALVRRTLGDIPCCALKVEKNGADQLVICLYGDRDQEIEERLKSEFETGLSEHARPKRIVWRTAVCRLPNGKLDRIATARAVEADLETTEEFDAPKAGTEEKLAEIWTEILGLDAVSRDANFFDLGGDSLKTISLYAYAERAGFVLSPNDIFEHPTVKGLADKITGSAQAGLDHIDATDVRKVHSDGELPPVVMLHGNLLVFYQLARGLGKDRPVGLKFTSLYEGMDLAVGATIESMAEGTISEFADFLSRDSCVLVGYSAGAAITLQMANLLTKRGCSVDLLCLVDPPMSLTEPLCEARSTQRRRAGYLRSGLELGAFAAGYIYHTIAGTQESRRRFKVNRATALAVNRFVADRYDGEVLLLSTLPMDEPPDRFPNATIEHVPFSHLDLLNDKDVAHLVAARLIANIRKR